MAQFCCLKPKGYIAKAHTGQKLSSDYKKLESLSKRVVPSAQRAYASALKGINKKLPAQFDEALDDGDYQMAGAYIPWEDLEEDFKLAKKVQERSVASSMLLVATGLVALSGIRRRAQAIAVAQPHYASRVAAPSLRVSVDNPSVQRWLTERTGSLIVNIQRDTLLNIQGAVEHGILIGQAPRAVAQTIRQSIGLYPRQQTALFNFRASLEAGGKHSAEKIDQLSAAYQNRLIDQRAQMIARTEMRAAVNYGQLTTWKEAANRGFFNRARAQKVWICDAEPCPICEPMDGEAVGLDESWTLEDGSVVDFPPDGVHPNCYCGMELELGGDDAGEDGENDENTDQEQEES